MNYKAEREARGLSARQVAVAAKVGLNTVYRLEAGRPVRPQIIVAIQGVLNERPLPRMTPRAGLLVPLSPEVEGLLSAMARSGLFGGDTPEAVAAEIIREAARAFSARR